MDFLETLQVGKESMKTFPHVNLFLPTAASVPFINLHSAKLSKQRVVDKRAD